ncbi:MAG TPA: redoxin domain-containing protein [Planctomycetaceae bacterium]|jgi:thiol-disulfide isomerase/thioredoxin|nr:redoxin domain-containing protein [Planctomycetaceae bacterium]
MSSRRLFSPLFALSVAASLALLGPALAPAAEARSIEQLLTAYRPMRPDVEIETPPRSEFSKCKVTVEAHGKVSGWVVLGPAGQVLRRFVDTDGDRTVDQWRYYNHGLEVYRDIDSNHNHKPDEHRWLNTGGSRWGIDSKEDGTIDSWKVLSPEEAVREALFAITHQDEKLLNSVLVTRDELRSIGVSDTYADKIMTGLAEPARKMRDAAAGSKFLSDRAATARADNLTPSALPAEDGKLRDDLIVYENAMAIVESSGKTGLVQVGELVRIGDVWKLTQIPQPIEGQNAQVMAGGILMQPTLAAAVPNATNTPAPSAEVQKVLTELQELDQKAPQPTSPASELASYNAKRADLLSQLVNSTKTEDERNQWMRQMIDSIASAVQIGAYPEGLPRLKSLESDLRDAPATAKSPMIPYIAYRRLLADYTTQQKTATNAKQQDVQKWWRGELEKFTKQFPTAEDAPEALLQLAIANEFTGQMPDAKKWYSELAEQHPQTKPGRRAAGALRRIDLKGKPFQFTGPLLDGGTFSANDYRGKVLLLAYWSTWCTACTQDIPVLKSLSERYGSNGFEIVGVNLDVAAAPVGPYLKDHKISWPQIFQPGGTESDPATALGIIVPPVMILVDRQGRVTNVTTAIDEIKTAVPELMLEKKAAKADSDTR